MRVAWALEEIGAPYELVRVSPDEVGMPEHLARHPLGRVPVLEEDGQALFESTGLLLYLGDRFPEAGLLPALGTYERALVYQWSIAALTELERHVVVVRFNRQSQPEWAAAAAERFATAAPAFEQALGGGDYLVGDALTVADIVTGGVLGLARSTELLDPFPELTEYYDRLRSRPAFQRAVVTTESLIRP